MKIGKITKGEHKGKVGQIISENNGVAFIAIEGEPQPVRVRIDWLKVLGFVTTVLELLKLLLKNKQKV